MLIHSTYTYLFIGSVSEKSEDSDSQNKSEEQVNLRKGTSPSNSSYDDGSRSTPSNSPKAATRQMKKRTSESEDEDFVVDEEVTSRRKCSRRSMLLLLPQSLVSQRKLLPRGSPCQKQESPPRKLWSSLLNQEKKTMLLGRKGKKQSRRLWPESLQKHI